MPKKLIMGADVAPQPDDFKFHIFIDSVGARALKKALSVGYPSLSEAEQEAILPLYSALEVA